MNIIDIILLILGILIFIMLVILLLKVWRPSGTPGDLGDSKYVDSKFSVFESNLTKQTTKIEENDKTLSVATEKLINNQKLVEELKQQINTLKDADIKTVGENQNRTINNIQDLTNQLSNNLKTVGDIYNSIGKLNDIFYNVKRRGNLGEYTLTTLLTNILGNDKRLWEAQYDLNVSSNKSNRGKVDFVIHTPKGADDIVIDSKFPLSAYQNIVQAIENNESEASYKQKLDEFAKNVKLHIKEVAKYISKENEISSAILYIPSESIFNFIVDNCQDVMDIAVDTKVWLSSPTMLASILNIILEYSKDYKLGENLNKLKEKISNLHIEYSRFDERWKNIEKSFKNTADNIKDFNITIAKIVKQQEEISNYEIIEEDANEAITDSV